MGSRGIYVGRDARIQERDRCVAAGGCCGGIGKKPPDIYSNERYYLMLT
jgi:hypothetical protein